MSAEETGTARITVTFPKITEIQAGFYVFMDGRYQAIEGVEFESLLIVLATTASRCKPHRAIFDIGTKTLTHEFGLRELSEEHRQRRLTDPSALLSPNDKLQTIPLHGDKILNLHEYYYGVRNGRVRTI